MDRPPELPTWTLMADHNGHILAVRQEYADEKRTMGWFVVARESDLLPFNTPRLIVEQADGFLGDGA